MKIKSIMTLIAGLTFQMNTSIYSQKINHSNYQGWESIELLNPFIHLHITPQLGGRIIQLSMDDHEYLWYNRSLAGQGPTETGLGPNDAWLNYGGEKLWPAPQGINSKEQWPGPPDAILDGSAHAAELIDGQDYAGVKLISQKDPYTGIQFKRLIKIFDSGTRVSIDATMKNIDNKKRRWGIWSVAQLDAENENNDGYNPNMHIYCPLNPRSMYRNGYKVLYGPARNTQYSVDKKNNLFHFQFQYYVGKVGLDCSDGWCATVDGKTGFVFVQRFDFKPNKPYPDNASVEIWSQGIGSYFSRGKFKQMPDDPNINPYLFESELLSPFAELQPEEEYTFHYDWYTTRIGDNIKIIDCNDFAVVCRPFSVQIKDNYLISNGQFGVFYPGLVVLQILDSTDKVLKEKDVGYASPLSPLVLDSKLDMIDHAAKARLIIQNKKGKTIGQIAETQL